MEVNLPSKNLWTTPIGEYITKRVLPKDKEEARKLIYKAAQYAIYDDIQYKSGFNLPLLRCIASYECYIYILREVHEGICGNHLGGTSLAQKIV